MAHQLATQCRGHGGRRPMGGHLADPGAHGPAEEGEGQAPQRGVTAPRLAPCSSARSTMVAMSTAWATMQSVARTPTSTATAKYRRVTVIRAANRRLTEAARSSGAGTRFRGPPRRPAAPARAARNRSRQASGQR